MYVAYDIRRPICDGEFFPDFSIFCKHTSKFTRHTIFSLPEQNKCCRKLGVANRSRDTCKQAKINEKGKNCCRESAIRCRKPHTCVRTLKLSRPTDPTYAVFLLAVNMSSRHANLSRTMSRVVFTTPELGASRNFPICNLQL